MKSYKVILIYLMASVATNKSTPTKNYESDSMLIGLTSIISFLEKICSLYIFTSGRKNPTCFNVF